MARRFKTRGIKANNPYQVDELANAACVSVPTVRNWIRDGMQLVDNNRPMIVMGFHALDYLNARRAKTKQPMALDQFYCMRCKARRTPFGAMADYVPSSEAGGCLKAICGVCECACNRNVSARDLPDICKVLDVKVRGSR
jgi:hypothetical protein